MTMPIVGNGICRTLSLLMIVFIQKCLSLEISGARGQFYSIRDRESLDVTTIRVIEACTSSELAWEKAAWVLARPERFAAGFILLSFLLLTKRFLNPKFNLVAGCTVFCADDVIAIHISEPLCVISDHIWPNGFYLFRRIRNIYAVDLRSDDLLQKICLRPRHVWSIHKTACR
jgi:hypothetical protein